MERLSIRGVPLSRVATLGSDVTTSQEFVDAQTAFIAQRGTGSQLLAVSSAEQPVAMNPMIREFLVDIIARKIDGESPEDSFTDLENVMFAAIRLAVLETRSKRISALDIAELELTQDDTNIGPDPENIVVRFSPDIQWVADLRPFSEARKDSVDIAVRNSSTSSAASETNVFDRLRVRTAELAGVGPFGVEHAKTPGIIGDSIAVTSGSETIPISQLTTNTAESQRTEISGVDTAPLVRMLVEKVFGNASGSDLFDLSLLMRSITERYNSGLEAINGVDSSSSGILLVYTPSNIRSLLASFPSQSGVLNVQRM